MTNQKELILTLKEVREARELSFDKIIKMIEDNNDTPQSLLYQDCSRKTPRIKQTLVMITYCGR